MESREGIGIDKKEASNIWPVGEDPDCEALESSPKSVNERVFSS